MPSISPELYLQYRGLLFGVAYRMLGCAADAEEVVQDSFVRLLSSDVDMGAPLKGWLLTVTLNQCRDRLRRKRNRTWLPGPILDAQALMAAGPEARLGALESVGVGFLLALETLSPDQRAVLVLRSVLGCSVEETAQLAGLTPTNVRTLHHRAHQRLTQSWDQRPQPVAQNMALLQEFLMCVAQGDIPQAARLLAPQAVAVTDGDGHRAARVVVTGPERIARMCVNLGRAQVEAQLLMCNGLPALLVHRTSNEGLHPVRHQDTSVSLLRLQVVGDQIWRVESVLGPRKLASVLAVSPKP